MGMMDQLKAARENLVGGLRCEDVCDRDCGVWSDVQVFGVGYSDSVKVDGQVTVSMREKKE